MRAIGSVQSIIWRSSRRHRTLLSCQCTQALKFSAEVSDFDKSALRDFEAALLADTNYIKDGPAAAVRITLEDWHGLAFTDFHNLIKEDGEWKIVAKVFHQYQ